MKLATIIGDKLAEGLSGANVLGIDIGSRTGKAVLISNDRLYSAAAATGINMQETADELFEELLQLSGLRRCDISYIVGTGYGRVALSFPDIPHQIVTEISCHSLGAYYLNPNVRTIIDIGGQDSKVIKVDPASGRVLEFVMNDKCAAGTGRFLERVASLLDLSIDELGQESVKSENPSDISSQCVVFAESEVISLRARGEARKDIAAGIHLAAARRIRNLLKRLGCEPELVFSGGVSNNIGMKKAIENLLGQKIAAVKLDTIFAGALGAAIHAYKYFESGTGQKAGNNSTYKLDLTDLENRIAKQQELLITSSSQIKKAGYLCTYTPLELISAAGVSHIRLFKSGNPEVIASGEQITQSVFCDFTKSILGAFKEKQPLYSSLDKVYTFYTCDCIKKVGEAIGDFFSPTDIYILPRHRGKSSSRDFYRSEIINFKNDLQSLSGKEISESDIHENIVLYNKVRSLLRDISQLRKRPDPPLKGKDYLDLIKAYYYLPANELLKVYEGIYSQLSGMPDTGETRIRLMMSGGIVADGDRKLLELLEDEIGARIVIEDHCTGAKAASVDVNEEDEPYAALADSYLGSEPCSRMKPLQERIYSTGRLAEEYEVDGILYVYLKFCPCYGQIKNEFFRHFQQLNLPVLEIPADYSRSDQGQIKTRVEAFIEVLKERKANPYSGRSA